MFGSDATLSYGGNSLQIRATAVESLSPFFSSVNSSITTGGAIRWYEGSDNGTSYIEIKAPDSLSSSFSWELPSDTPSDGDVLTWNTGDVLSWEPAGAGSGIDDGDTLSVGLTFPNTGLHILDTNASHDLIVAPGSDLTADRTLTITTGDSNRVLTLSGDTTLSGTNTGDVTLAGSLDYITISGQVITRNAVDLTTDITGTLPIANGGTNLTALGSANQLLRVNSGGTALEYFTQNTSSVITNGGNTTGAAVTIGTNDAFDLNFETNNVTRMTITGGASTGGKISVTDVASSSSAIEDVLTLTTNTSGTPNTSFGTGILLRGRSATVNDRDMVRLNSI